MHQHRARRGIRRLDHHAVCNPGDPALNRRTLLGGLAALPLAGAQADEGWHDIDVTGTSAGTKNNSVTVTSDQGTGNTAVSSWQDQVYLDTGTTLSSKAVSLGSFTHYGVIAAGGSYTQARPIRRVRLDLDVASHASND